MGRELRAELLIGLLKSPVKTVLASYTLTDAEQVINADITGGAIVLSLPSAASQIGKLRLIRRVGTGAATVTLDPLGAELIDDAATKILDSTSSMAIIASDGVSWYSYGGGGGGGTLTFKDEGSTVAGSPHSSLNFVGGRIAATDLTGGAAQAKVARQIRESVTTQAITGTDTALTDQLNQVPVDSATGAAVLLYLNSALAPSSWYSVSGQIITWNASSAAPNLTTSDSLVAVYETMS